MRVLLVEDEPDLSDVLRAALVRRDCIVDHVALLSEAIEAVLLAAYDVILLDWNLPDGAGIDLIREVRRSDAEATPIIILSARQTLDDRVRGLDHGADDYLVKPFDVPELLARMRALRRRPATVPIQAMTLGRLSVSISDGSVSVNGADLVLPRRERAVAECLIKRAGRVVLRETLENAVFGFDDEIASNTLDAHISRLRAKLAASDAKVEIQAVRGVGYLMRALDEE